MTNISGYAFRMPPPIPPSNPGSGKPPVIPPTSPALFPPAAPQTLRKDSPASKAVRWSVIVVVFLIAAFIGFRMVQFAIYLKNRPAHPNSGVSLFLKASEHIGPKGETASGNSDDAKLLNAAINGPWAKTGKRSR